MLEINSINTLMKKISEGIYMCLFIIYLTGACRAKTITFALCQLLAKVHTTRAIQRVMP